MVYDLWGDAVNLAFQLQAERVESGIFVTDRLAEGLPASVRLVEAGVIATADGEQKVWRVELEPAK